MAKPSSNPWGKFFWNDYESDPCLRACSLAAQGLWMRMLCLAAKATPVGHVKIGGEPCTVQDLARLVGESDETVTALLGELERRGVYSRSRNGTIYNRRMVGDAKRSETNSQNGKKGGEASVRKQKGIFGSPKRNDERGPERGDGRGPEPQKPKARSRSPLTPQGGDGEILDFGIKDRELREAYERRLRGFAASGFWIAGGTWGPPPTDPDCEIPRAMIRHFLPDIPEAAD